MTRLDTALIQRDEGGWRPDVVIGMYKELLLTPFLSFLPSTYGIASCEPNRVSHVLCIQTVLGHPSTNDPAGVIPWVVDPGVVRIPMWVAQGCTPCTPLLVPLLFPLMLELKHGTLLA